MAVRSRERLAYTHIYIHNEIERKKRRRRIVRCSYTTNYNATKSPKYNKKKKNASRNCAVRLRDIHTYTTISGCRFAFVRRRCRNTQAKSTGSIIVILYYDFSHFAQCLVLADTHTYNDTTTIDHDQ